MRIISGKYKGRNLEGYEIDGTRPTMNRVKESLFASIQDYIVDSTILDLFAGSGNLGLEAMSMGSKFAYLVDYNKKACSIIEKNVKLLKENNIEIICKDYEEALKKLNNDKIKLDIIFLDPPYKTDYIEESIKLISEYNLLNNNGLIVCESDNLNRIIYNEKYTVLKSKKYGEKHVVILQKV